MAAVSYRQRERARLAHQSRDAPEASEAELRELIEVLPSDGGVSEIVVTPQVALLAAEIGTDGAR